MIRNTSILWTAAASVILAACICEDISILPVAVAYDGASKLQSSFSGRGSNPRTVRQRGYSRTSPSTVDNQWWGSSAQIINVGSKSSKARNGGKSGKGAKGQSQPQQNIIIVYLPSPTKKPISIKPTISPKPTTSPTPSPTRDPSAFPSVAPSRVVTAAPSDIPSVSPSSYPTGTASEIPSERPSPLPSAGPSVSPLNDPSSMPSKSFSSDPSSHPSGLPSMQATAVPSTIASSIMPTARPEAFNLSNMPSKIGLKSPSPTVDSIGTLAPAPTKQVTGAPSSSPLDASEGSNIPTTDGDGIVTSSPDGSASNVPTVPVTSRAPEFSLSPVSISTLPTVTTLPTFTQTNAPITKTRQLLQMQLFGIEVLTPSLIDLYQNETEAYIEDFYNNITGSDDDVGSSVTYVRATLKVVNWTQPIDPFGSQRLFPTRKIGDDTDLIAEDKAKVIVLDVTEPCTGEPPLTVTFELELKYRVDDSSLRNSDLIFSAPFLTVESRSEYISDYLQSGDEFSDLYCSSRIIIPDGLSLVPTISISQAPSISQVPSVAPTSRVTSEDVIIDERDELIMQLYGIDILTQSRIETYEKETAAYIEDFYNNYTDSKGGVRGKVYDVSAVVTVVDWSQPANPFVSGIKRVFPVRKIGRDADLIAEDKAKVVVLDVSEPCVGEFPLTVTFAVELEYRVDDPSVIQSDLIISTPFRTVESRTVYIGEYLQSGDVFNGVYCSSRIVSDGRSPAPTTFNTPVFPGGLTPTPSSLTNSTGTPTVTSVPTIEIITDSIQPTFAPSVVNETSSMTPTFDASTNATISSTPSLAPSINGTISPSPSFINASAAPSVLNRSVAPTVLNSSAPTMLNTSAPTMLNTSAPSVFVSVAPTATPPPWEMRLYGMIELLELGQALYEERTALYIEEFYNGSSSDGIRANISDMEAIVEIVGQIPPETTRSSLKIAHHGIRKHRPKQHPNEGAFSFQSNEKHFDFGDRFLQEDPCSGPFLLLRLKITITYVTLDTSLTAEEVLKEAFSTEEYRNDYVNNYLEDGAAGAITFADLTCVSELLEFGVNKPLVPSPAPILSSLAPSITSDGNTTSAPSADNMTSNVTLSPSLASNATTAPSSFANNITSTPTITPNNTTIPPFDSNSTLSPVPTDTISNVTLSPSLGSNATTAPFSFANNITSTPTITPNNTTSVPTIISVNPDNSTPSPSIVISNITTPSPDSVEIDDIFGDPLKSIRSSSFYDRKCSAIETTNQNFEEIAVTFVYGVESTTQQNFFIRDLEELILDFLTTSILRCDSSHTSIEPRMNRDAIDFGVARIRYPISGDITSISKYCL